MCAEGNIIQQVEALATRVEIGIENNQRGLPTTTTKLVAKNLKAAMVSEQKVELTDQDRNLDPNKGTASHKNNKVRTS